MHRRQFSPKTPWNVAGDSNNPSMTYHLDIQTQIGSAWVLPNTFVLKSLVRKKHRKYAIIWYNWFLEVFCMFVLVLHKFIVFKLSQTYRQSISVVQFQCKRNHIIPLIPKNNFGEKKRFKCSYFPNALKYRKKWQDLFLKLVQDLM